eukprot:TRINITY_DN517_c0_g2_i1.p1 TRINITY_DN517_c0_g2~~TRINITY_DN517_c0_g2_i1.p1  ORF type:complete len:316 (-),score=38.60 TRINITY_DN517_c0_g2_i1:401-1348(-)
MDLEKYLQGIIGRSDVFNSEPLKHFLQLESHAPEAVVTPPQFLDEGCYSHGLRDFHYQEDKGILISLVSEMNVVSRVDSLLTNIKMPWENSTQDVLVTVGAVEFYGQISVDNWKFEIIWAKTFASQAICMMWDQSTGLLAVGLDDGSLYIEKVYAESNYIKHEQDLSAKVHSARIMGVAIDNLTNLCYTISEDKYLKCVDITRGMIIAEVPVSANKLTALILDKDYKRAFITNKANDVYVYDISTPQPYLLHQFQTVYKNVGIRGLHYDAQKNYIFTCGHNDGSITVFDLGKPGKEKFVKPVMTLQGKAKARVIK